MHGSKNVMPVGMARLVAFSSCSARHALHLPVVTRVVLPAGKALMQEAFEIVPGVLGADGIINTSIKALFILPVIYLVGYTSDSGKLRAGPRQRGLRS